MKNELKGTETEKNLIVAFAGATQAGKRYDIFAKKAKKDGFVRIHDIFSRVADQERAHGSRLFKFFTHGDVEIQATFPASGSSETVINLKNAASAEHNEWQNLYPSFAEKAKEEGFEAISIVFESIANAEKHHESVFLALVKNIEDGEVFSRKEKVMWHCIKCGYTFIGTEAPKACPACAHGQAYFEVLGENR